MAVLINVPVASATETCMLGQCLGALATPPTVARNGNRKRGRKTLLVALTWSPIKSELKSKMLDANRQNFADEGTILENFVEIIQKSIIVNVLLT